jgi:predicted PolB exonuclease-like 3'-5' exonuclease
MSIFVFDIETVPDVESGRRLYGIEDLDDNNIIIVKRMYSTPILSTSPLN